ncbi:MAG: hypothetical protein WBG01_16870 [Bacteroidota bacterium]
MRRLAAFFLLFWITPLYATAQEAGEELTWPRELQTERARIILYQPQLESFAGNILEGRMALALQPEGKDLTFGALWFKGHMSTDLDERLVYLERVEIPNVRFPDLDSSDVEELKAFVIAEVESWEIELSLDRLLASMESEGGVGGLSQNLNNDPPDIYFRTNSAILVSIDGEPILNDVENSNLKYVVNTPYFIVQNPGDGRYYIKGGKFWFTSGEITKGWVETKEVPRDIQDLATQVIEEPEEGADSVMAAMDTAPEIIVATRSSELIITDGEPDYASIEGTSLLYVNNSESDIIMDINTQQHYVLLAGRWFKSGTLKDGEWTFEEPGDLPEDFARIPESSDIATVRTSVPGTDEARDAVLEQSIPQTAAVDRKTATVSVQYDGNPKFERVSGTDVAYAANADKTVMLINDKYYCVDDGIWFESQKAMGPWEVSVQRPDEVDDLPPDSPVYNVKYVYVYDYTPEVVYVGYTPGYTWSYVYGGVVVYGTGFYYHPWYAHYYYPRPVTWGFGVHYNPWTGWGFSVGVRYGWFSVGFHRYGGWWGPAGYRHGYRHGYHRGFHHGYRAGARAGYRAGQAAGERPAHRNVYRNRASGVRTTGGRAQTRPQTRGTPTTRNRAQPSTRPNDVYSDRKGNVYRRDQGGNWQQRSGGQWSGSQQQRGQSQSRDLNRAQQNRSRGNQNYNNYRSQRSQPSSRSGGGRRR